MKKVVGMFSPIMTAKEQEKSQKLSSFLRNAISVIPRAVWLTVSFLFTSIALILIIVSAMLAFALNMSDKYFGKNRRNT